MNGRGHFAEPTGDEASCYPARRNTARTSQGASPGRQGGRPAHSPSQNLEVESRQRPRRPHPQPAGPNSRSDLRPSWAWDLGREEPGSRRHLTTAPWPQPWQAEQPRRLGEPTHHHPPFGGCCEAPRDPLPWGVPTSSSWPPISPTPRVPATSSSETGLKQARTHLGIQAPPPLPGCSGPRLPSAPSGFLPLRPPRPWPPPSALLRTLVGRGVSRDRGRVRRRAPGSLGNLSQGRGSSPRRLLGNPL